MYNNVRCYYIEIFNISHLLFEKNYDKFVALFTLNHAAYNAGKKNRVKKVATINPPIIATAIGPKKILRDNGIMAKTAANAVNTIGRQRRAVASIMADQGSCPA